MGCGAGHDLKETAQGSVWDAVGAWDKVNARRVLGAHGGVATIQSQSRGVAGIFTRRTQTDIYALEHLSRSQVIVLQVSAGRQNESIGAFFC